MKPPLVRYDLHEDDVKSLELRVQRIEKSLIRCNSWVMYNLFCKSQRGVLAASELLEYLNFTRTESASGGVSLQTRD